MTWRKIIGLRLLYFGLRVLGGCCANRTWRTISIPGYELKFQSRKISEPDHFSRTELYDMLKIIRREEKRMEWTCPEPEEEGGKR